MVLVQLQLGIIDITIIALLISMYDIGAFTNATELLLPSAFFISVLAISIHGVL